MDLSDRLGQPKESHWSNEAQFNCPFCLDRVGKQDDKYHLYVNETKGKFICFRCEAKGTTAQLYSFLHLAPLTLQDNSFFDKLISLISTPEKKPTLERSLPPDFVPVVRGSRAYRYLVQRGLDDSDLDYYELGTSETKLRHVPEDKRRHYIGAGRVALIDRDIFGDICYWTARSLGGHAAPYKNAPWPGSDQLFDLDRAIRADSERLIVVEGPFDALATSRFVGRGITFTYGKGFSREQVRLLVEKVPMDKEICIAYDPDALGSSNRLAKMIAGKGRYVTQAHLPEYHDPGSLGELFCEFVDKAVPYDA